MRILLGLLAGIILGIGVTLGYQHITEDTVTQLEDLPGYGDAHDQAAIYCTLGGVVPGMKSLYDPDYLACVEDRTRQEMVTAGTVEADTAPSRKD